MKPIGLVILLLTQAPLPPQAKANLVRFASNEIAVAAYDDNAHGKYFANVFRDARLKRLAVVINNSTAQPVIASHVHWKWIGADGKPGELVQENNSLVTLGGFVADSRSTVLILPDGTATQTGQRPSGMYGMYRIPPSLLTAPTVTVELEAVVLADGEVIGPDKTGLVEEMKGQADAAARVKDIINAARAQGRDPRADIAAAAEEKSLPPATRRHIQLLTRGGRRNGPMPEAPPQIVLPNFHRK